MLTIGDGPHQKKSEKFQWNAFAEIFKSKKWRRAAFGYFGHMWELYTYWGFIPVILGLYAEKHNISLNIPLISFLIIGSGFLSCIAGGYLSLKIGSAKVATIALLVSGVCCFLSPLIYQLPLVVFLAILFVWGLAVIPDSPQFSTLVATYAPQHLKGTALKIYNSIGFAISSISLIVIDRIFHSNSFFGKENTMLLLGIGALIGLPSMFKLISTQNK
jgi:predicted MFS family arabinose efflux permease